MKEKYTLKKTKLAGVFEIEIRFFEDSRGYFLENYNKEDFKKVGIDEEFVQDNESRSIKNVFRGLHFQKPPYAQGKLVRVIKGKIKDVVVDIRKSSPTYGQWESFILDNSKKMLWVPIGFAHGFLSMEDDTVVHYKVTNVYNKESEGGLLWNDPELGIDWGEGEFVVSDKDKEYPKLKDLKSPFE